jgi:hypothetical protein
MEQVAATSREHGLSEPAKHISLEVSEISLLTASYRIGFKQRAGRRTNYSDTSQISLKLYQDDEVLNLEWQFERRDGTVQ